MSSNHLIHSIDMGEKHIHKFIADGLLKLANELDPNSNSDLEIEWRKKIEQNGRVQKVLHVMNFCKPFILKFYRS